MLRDPGGAAKIGYSLNVLARKHAVKSGVGTNLILEWVAPPHPDARRIEEIAHALLTPRQSHAYPAHGTEWFHVTAVEAKSAITQATALWDDHKMHALKIAIGYEVARLDWVYETATPDVDVSVPAPRYATQDRRRWWSTAHESERNNHE